MFRLPSITITIPRHNWLPPRPMFQSPAVGTPLRSQFWAAAGGATRPTTAAKKKAVVSVHTTIPFVTFAPKVANDIQLPPSGPSRGGAFEGEAHSGDHENGRYLYLLARLSFRLVFSGPREPALLGRQCLKGGGG